MTFWRRLFDSSWFLPAICCLIAGFLRFHHLEQASLWRDEIYSIGESELLSHILVRKGNGFGYFFLLHAIRSVFGTSAWSLRFLSALAGTVATLVAWSIAYKVSGRKSAAVVSALVVALLPLSLMLSRDARMYAPWALVLWTAYFCMLHLDAKKHAIAFYGTIAAILAALSLHNFTLFYLPGLMLAWWVYPHSESYTRQKATDATRLMVVIVAAGALLALRLAVQVPNFFSYVLSFAKVPYWAGEVKFADNLLQLVFFGEQGARAFPRLSSAGWVGAWGILWAFAVFQSVRIVGPKKAASIALALLVPILLFAILPIRHYPRLLVPCVLFVHLPFAICLSGFHRNLVFRVVALLFLGVLLVFAWRSTQLDREPWNEVCNKVAANSTDKTVIATWPQAASAPFRYCYRGPGEVVDFPRLVEGKIPIEGKQVWILLFPPITALSLVKDAASIEKRLTLKRVASPIHQLQILAPPQANWP